MARHGLVEAVCVLLLNSLAVNVVTGSICCIYSQYEAHIDQDNANVFVDLGRLGTTYGYSNASIHMAYDFTNNRTYLNVSTIELSPLIPQPVKDNYEVINDYKKRITYVFQGSTCNKITLSDQNQQCIPDAAVRMWTGYIGNKEKYLATYSYTYPLTTITYRATLDPKTCVPAFITYSTKGTVAQSGSMNSMLISNVTVGIKNPAVFNPPASCLKGSEAKLSEATENHLRTLLTGGFLVPFHDVSKIEE